MDTSGGSFFLSYLKALSNKQILALEDWQKQRRLDPSAQDDAIYRLQGIMNEKARRGLLIKGAK
jgi:hypothetical protein